MYRVVSVSRSDDFRKKEKKKDKDTARIHLDTVHLRKHAVSLAIRIDTCPTHHTFAIHYLKVFLSTEGKGNIVPVKNTYALINSKGSFELIHLGHLILNKINPVL